MNNGSLPPPTQGLAPGASNFLPLQTTPLIGAMMPPRFTRQPEPQAAPQRPQADRERRSLFKPDYSDVRLCFRQVPTGKIADDGGPIMDLVQVTCAPRSTAEPPKKKGWCTLL